MTVTRSVRAEASRNERGSAESRRRRREWLLLTYRANVDLCVVVLPIIGPVEREVPLGEGQPVCRCYRCGDLLTLASLTVDRIVPGCHGGTYRRTNIRPACFGCNSETGQKVRTRRPRGA